MLILFSIALIINTNSSSATAVNPILNNSIQANSTENVGVNSSTSNLTTSNVKNSEDSITNTTQATPTTTNTAINTSNTTQATPTTTNTAINTSNTTQATPTTTNTPVNTTNAVVNTTTTKSTVNTTTQVNNSTEAAGAPILVNNMTVAQLKTGLAYAQAYFNLHHSLPPYVVVGSRHIATATFEKNLATQGLKINTTIVNGLTVAELKDGLARVQAFFNKNGRLPNYVSFGTRHIAIATFEKNLATQKLKINTTKAVTKKITPNTSSVAALAASLKGSTPYSTAVNIYNWVKANINYAFYYDSKYGAAGTLTHRLGNCCDMANLLVALGRDDGIQSRYEHGYCHFSSGWYGHVWAQFYVNGKWLIADATSYSNSLGVVKNWNTATYTLEGIYTTLPF